MHKEEYAQVEKLVNKHLAVRPTLRVLEVGSLDVNGTHRPIFD